MPPFFDETLGWWRLSAIIFGFVGMGLIVCLGSEGLGLYSYYVVGVVFCVALRDLITRYLSNDVPSLLVTFFHAVGILLYSVIAFLWTDWVPVSPEGVKLLFLAAGFVSIAYWLSVLVMRNGDISFVAPSQYIGLSWALLVGCWVLNIFQMASRCWVQGSLFFLGFTSCVEKASLNVWQSLVESLVINVEPVIQVLEGKSQ